MNGDDGHGDLDRVILDGLRSLRNATLPSAKKQQIFEAVRQELTLVTLPSKPPRRWLWWAGTSVAAAITMALLLTTGLHNGGPNPAHKSLSSTTQLVRIKPSNFYPPIQAASSEYFTISAEDAQGHRVSTNDTIKLTFSSPSSLLKFMVRTPNGPKGYVATQRGPLAVRLGKDTWEIHLVHGSNTVRVMQSKAGTFTIKAVDVSSANGARGKISYSIIPAVGEGVAGWEFIDAQGHVVGVGAIPIIGWASPEVNVDGSVGVTIPANKPVKLWLQAIDPYGNPITVTQSEAKFVNVNANGIELHPPNGVGQGAKGEFRLTPNGPPVTHITLKAGMSRMPIWYENDVAQDGPPSFFDGAAGVKIQQLQ